jgi:hypothetical protein
MMYGQLGLVLDQSGGDEAQPDELHLQPKLASERQEDELNYTYDPFKDSWSPVQ